MPPLWLLDRLSRTANDGIAFCRFCESFFFVPWCLSQTWARQDSRWRINPALQEAIKCKRPGTVKFSTLFTCSTADERDVFEQLLSGCRNAEKEHKEREEQFWLQDYALYSFSRDESAGCILCGHASDWDEMQQPFFELLQSAGVEHLKSTTLMHMGDRNVEDDRASQQLIAASKIHNVPGLRLQAVKAILDLEEIAPDSEQRERFMLLFARNDDITKSIVAYDPRYWWGYVYELRTLCQNIIEYRNHRVLAYFMLAYTRIEADLRRLVVEHFRFADDSRMPVEKRECAMLAKCGLQEGEMIRPELGDALQKLNELKRSEMRPELREEIKRVLGKCDRYLSDLAGKEARVTLGLMPRVIKKLRQLGAITDEAWAPFEHDFMKKWNENLEAAANDRNDLMHGTVLDVFASPRGGAAAWERLLENYILVFPQVHWILDALRKNLDTIPEDNKILIE